MSSFRLLIAVLFLIQIGSAQDPKGVSLTLTTKNGKGRFRVGEVIPLELRLMSGTPGRYEVMTYAYHRVYLNSPPASKSAHRALAQSIQN
jgi:hypothetical protein